MEAQLTIRHSKGKLDPKVEFAEEQEDSEVKNTDHDEGQEEEEEATLGDDKETGHVEDHQEEEVVENKRSSKVYKYTQYLSIYLFICLFSLSH